LQATQISAKNAMMQIGSIFFNGCTRLSND